MYARAARTAAAVPMALLRRGYREDATKLRRGDVFSLNGKYVELLAAQAVHKGRGGAFLQADVRDIHSGGRYTAKLRTNDVFDVQESEVRAFLFDAVDVKKGVLAVRPDGDVGPASAALPVMRKAIE